MVAQQYRYGQGITRRTCFTKTMTFKHSFLNNPADATFAFDLKRRDVKDQVVTFNPRIVATEIVSDSLNCWVD